MALGAVSALNEMKIAIPDKMSICSFGEFKYHAVLNPDMTVADQQSYNVEKKAAEVLIEKTKVIDIFYNLSFFIFSYLEEQNYP